MNSNEFNRLLNELLDGTITEEELKQFEEAVEKVPAYREEYEAYKRLMNSVDTLPADITPQTGMWKKIEGRLPDNKIGFKKIAANFYTFGDLSDSGASRIQSKENRKSQLPLRYIGTGLIAAMLLISLIYFIPSIFKLNTGTTTIASLDNYWLVSNVKGSPKILDKVIKTVDSIRTGEWLVTDDSSQAILKVANLGTIIVDPGSKMKILINDKGEHRIIIEYGTINANINSTKNLFVQSHSATAVDMKGDYTFTTDKKGNGVIYVKSGSVSLLSDLKKSIVTAGSFCIMKEGMGPGTPYRENSSSEFKKALLNYDFNNGGAAALNSIIQHSDKLDAGTLLSLIPDADKNAKAQIYAKLSKIVSPPSDIPADSLPYVNLDRLTDWVNEIQKQIDTELAVELKKLDKVLNTSIKINTDSLKLSPEEQAELEEQMQELQEELQGAMEEIRIEFDGDFKMEMEEMKNELKESMKNYEFNNKQFQVDMQELQEELQESLKDMDFNSEEFKVEMENMKIELDNMNFEFDDEWQENMKELGRELEENQHEREREQRELERELEENQRERERDQRELERELEQDQRELERELEQEQGEREREQEELQRELEQEQRERERELEQENNNN